MLPQDEAGVIAKAIRHLEGDRARPRTQGLGAQVINPVGVRESEEHTVVVGHARVQIIGRAGVSGPTQAGETELATWGGAIIGAGAGAGVGAAVPFIGGYETIYRVKRIKRREAP